MKQVSIIVASGFVMMLILTTNIINQSVPVVALDNSVKCVESYLTIKDDGSSLIVKMDGKNYLLDEGDGIIGKTLYSQEISNNEEGGITVKYNFTETSSEDPEDYMEYTVPSKEDIPDIKLPYYLDNEVLFQHEINKGPLEIEPLVGTTNVCKKEK